MSDNQDISQSTPAAQWKSVLGYGLLLASCVAWLAIFALPFLDLSGAQIAGATTTLIIIGEVVFWLAIFLLGRPAWERIKAFFGIKPKAEAPEKTNLE